jgi:isocitrate dehydrogenase
LEHLATASGNAQAKVLAVALDKATEKLLINRKSPSTKVPELDNRGSQFYLAMYWAEAMAEQNDDTALKSRFAPLAKSLAEKEAQIVAELNGVQGHPVDIDGYYAPNPDRATSAMRPSATFNAALAAFA